VTAPATRDRPSGSAQHRSRGLGGMPSASGREESERRAQQPLARGRVRREQPLAHVPIGDGPKPRRWLEQWFGLREQRVGTREIFIGGDDHRDPGREAKASNRRLPQHMPLLESFVRGREPTRIRQCANSTHRPRYGRGSSRWRHQSSAASSITVHAASRSSRPSANAART
jgi:hypothetical protein